MDIFELAKAKKMFGGGGGKREGTAIPVGQAVDMIYFNCHNTMDETNEILSQLTYVDIGVGSPVYIAYAALESETSGDILAIFEIDHDAKRYQIAKITDIATAAYTAYFWGGSDNGANGWGIEMEQPVLMYIPALMAGIPVISWYQPLTDLMGVPIGAENEKIKNVLSITPF